MVTIEELELAYRQHYRRFARVARALVGDPERAHDAVQESFARAIRGRAGFRGEGSSRAGCGESFPLTQRPPRRLPPRVVTPAARALPTQPPAPPTQPVQRGSADGFSVVAGRNGSVQFTKTGTTPALRRLDGHSAGYSCFRLTREFGIFTVRGLGEGGRFAPSVGFALHGVGAPLDGCEVQASFGRRWPDPLGGHAAAEIPLTAAGRRFFADRAAARDLALFVRSRRMHTLRRGHGDELLRDVRAAYPALAHSRIRIAPTATGAVYSETSPTGRTFTVTVSHGRIVKQNLKPYGFVF